MKRTLRVKLAPTSEQAAALAATLARAAQASGLAAEIAHERDIRHWMQLRQVAYGRVRELGIGAQLAISCIRRAADARKTLLANAKNGRLGTPDSPRYSKALSKPVTFRSDAALAFDDRCLSWNHNQHTVSLSTVHGRLKDIPFTGNSDHLTIIATARKGETDLIHHQGAYYLAATIDEQAPTMFEPRGFLGVDLGIANIATTSDGHRASGTQLNRIRHRNRRLRSKLQTKETKSAKRLLRKRSRTETRFAKDINHQISKKVVAEAKRTGRGIALENLTGIRERVRSRKPQRARLSSWAFAELASFITYKAERSGVPVLFIDPAYTSQDCHSCGHRDRGNRPNQATFHCQHCGVSLHADENAALNIAQRAVESWGAVKLPNAA